ncbi:hypothetical protein KW807_02160 [Candidatus Parcubacteria bacterium]|nr:hypothetical protein [Candidatus Parcubacteria bacterium]
MTDKKWFIGALVLAVAAFLLVRVAKPSTTGVKDTELNLIPLEFSLEPLKIPTPQVPVAESPELRPVAWQVFSQYRSFLKSHDLEGVRSLSYQTSATCLDPNQRKACYQIMDKVTPVIEAFEESDFTHVYADNKQIVMITDLFNLTEDKDSKQAQALLFFTRTESGEPRILGLRYCFKNKEDTSTSCFIADPSLRDKDKNGWWDQVEALFYK